MLKRFTYRKQIIKLLVLPACLAFGCACRSPLAEVPAPDQAALELKITMEDHSRNLKRLKAIEPGEANTPQARSEALEAQRRWLESEFKAEARDRGLAVGKEENLRLVLDVTSLGEVRAKYIVYGIAGGVGWGVGTGLVAHDPRLAVGLGLYELVEESAFWIAGSAVFGAYSAPAVVKASVFDRGNSKPIWKASFYIINGRKYTKGLPQDQRSDRATQLHASLRVFLDKLFKDLEGMPGFPRRAGPRRTLASSGQLARSAPALP